MDDEQSPDYDNTHRAFLQVFLAKGTLTFEEAKPILANILTANGKTPLDLNTANHCTTILT